ncbi:MAG TPA: DEAD/DEAH box helicase [Candidatus Nanoarchaeia archaeon]|nr:DEAD/DEAH box helicase [Candidatus Nanoarchaeia archaeon]
MMIHSPDQKMQIASLPLPDFFKNHYASYPSLTPIQEKALAAGLLEGKSLLICAPTASGKTLVASMAICNQLKQGKAIYVVPLKALANEKFKEFKRLLEKTEYKTTISIGDIDSPSPYLANYDLIILTSEKLDSLLRHKADWIYYIKTIIVDEIHLLNDPTRGPTLEIILTLLKTIISPQIIGLSATIGNPKELAKWLGAELVQDSWRPVELKQGIHVNGETEFY